MIVRKLFSFQRRIFNFFYSLLFSKGFDIVDEDVISTKIITVKNETIERIYFPEIYGLTKGGMIDFLSPELVLKKIVFGKIYYGSDFISKDGLVFWKKFFLPQWQKMIPSDAFMFKVKHKKLYIKKEKKHFQVDVGFSLIGVHSQTWTHFLFQYFPKLFYLNEVSNLEQSLTVIHPVYKDPQVAQIFDYFTRSFTNINFLPLQEESAVTCKVLYHINNTSQISDHATYVAPSDIIIPEFVLEKIKLNLNSFLMKTSTDILKDYSHEMIYLGRRGQRSLINSEEVESFFKLKGFRIVYPDKYTLQEKFALFHNAKIIAGPGSSAFSNIIFSKPETKVLIFSNYQRLNDALSYFKYFDINFLMLNDEDVDQSIHSSYKISLNKLAMSYDYLLNKSDSNSL